MTLAEIRKRKLISQTELAMQAGISQAYVCALERGERKNPSASVINSIARSLDIRASDVLQLLDNREKEESRNA